MRIASNNEAEHFYETATFVAYQFVSISIRTDLANGFRIDDSTFSIIRLAVTVGRTLFTTCTLACKEGEFTFDLSPLNTKNPRFSVNATSAGTSYMYTFQPCTPLAECGAATTAAACQTAQTAGSVSYNLGTSNSANFNGSIIANTLELQFTEGLEGRRTFIKMVCKKDGDPELKYEDESPSKNYKFILLSSYACQPSPTPSPGRGLSPGSVLVILYVLMFS
ncbi:hypothetical protein DPMN_057779 [Dreissena polymorpha]|uniref:MRH domain-containing protein n=1 Tax=Dreissena polymorpha TaxID=45954 RepID=A0A9D4C0T0_DREPO|nr:hypothetical protein DPMN_057779 [Dreissena polymorpha]